MPKAAFASLLDKIAEFAGDAVIDLSLWGELSLHPDHIELIEMVLAHPALSLVIETSGIGWKEEELKALAAIQAVPRKNHMAPLSWVVSLDALDPERYKELRGPGFSEAQSCAKTLLSLFPNDAYVQAVRLKGAEDDIEKFYRFWKGENSKQVIIQKYDDFAGAFPKMQAADLSPVKRRPCWHIQRDMIILLDGRVPNCRENLAALKGGAEVLGNAFSDDLSLVWEKGAALYNGHCKAEYPGICALCDEYYTYNF
jgi:spiro-SPASM protein